MREDLAELVSGPDRLALLVVDMQNDFVLPEGAVPAEGAPAIVPVIAGLAERARARRAPVVYTREMHRADLSDFGIELEFEPPHCLEESAGAEIVAGLEPRQGDIVVTGKRRYDAFLGTDLDLLLRASGVENLVVTGVCTDVCVSATVQHARNLDYRCFVLSDAVAGTSAERHEAALLCLGHAFAHVGTFAEVAPLFGL